MQVGADGWSGRKSPMDTVLPSMSTLAGVGEDWSSYVQTSLAEGVADNIGRLVQMEWEEIVDEVEGYRWGARGTKMGAAQRGTFLHDTLECWMHGEHGPELPAQYADQLQPYIDRLAEWVERNRPKLIAAEEAVYNAHAEAAGRYDLFCLLEAGPHEGREVLADLKTKDRDTTARGYPARPYASSVALQLAGYKYADYQFPFVPRKQEKDQYGGRVYLMNKEEKELLVETPWAGRQHDIMTAVIFLTPLRCSTYEINTSESVLDYLIAASETWQWNKVECRVEGMVGEET